MTGLKIFQGVECTGFGNNVRAMKGAATLNNSLTKAEGGGERVEMRSSIFEHVN